MNCSQGARPCQCLMFKSILPKKGCVVEPEPPPCSYFVIRVECASWCNEPRYFHFKVVSVQLLSLVLAGLGFCLGFFSWCFWPGRSLLVKADLLEPYKCARQQKPLPNHASLSVGWWPFAGQGPLLLPLPAHTLSEAAIGASAFPSSSVLIKLSVAVKKNYWF